MASQTHLHIRFALRHSDPPIVRELEVPANYSVYELHLAMQVSLGWNDREPFEFVRSKLTVGIEPTYSGEGLLHDGHAYRHADDIEASELLQQIGQRVNYTYDFSRLWEFELTLVARVERESELPTCLRVEEAAPIEDADDLQAFYGMLIAAADPSLELHDLAVQFLGEDFDSSGPPIAEVTEHLSLLFADEIEPHGSEQDADDNWGWWDPSKYDDKMRLRIKQEEIEDAIPVDLAKQSAADKHANLLQALRGSRPS